MYATESEAGVTASVESAQILQEIYHERISLSDYQKGYLEVKLPMKGGRKLA
jgi:hypothetical protein